MRAARLTRRSVIAGLASLGMHGIANSAANRVDLSLGLQLFSLDTEMKHDLPGTLREVRAIGYRHVELVGYYGLDPGRLRAQLQAASLECSSIHIRPHGSAGGLPGLAADPERHFAMCRALGVQYLVCPGPWFPESVARALPTSNLSIADIVAAVNRMTEDDWRHSAELVNKCAGLARQRGLELLYHNGNLEFVPSGSGTGFDTMLQFFNTKLVKIELDCGWVMAAGRDPTQYLREQAGLMPLIHVKDMQATPPNTRMELNPAQIGEGVVDWPALLGAAKEAGVTRAYIEQEAPFARPAMEYARNNFRYLTSLQ